MADESGITEFLERVRAGDERAADVLLPAVYAELRRLAESHLQRERPEHTLQATALVHEAYLRLVGQHRVTWQSRAHFFAVAAQAIRRILVDHARMRQVAKRGGGRERLSLDTAQVVPQQERTDLLALNEALDRLAGAHPDKARLVELRFFGGLTNDEVAEVMDVTSRTVERHWQFARAWLFREIAEDETPPPSPGGEARGPVTSDRARGIDDLFAEALARPPAERERYLDEACGDDHTLRRELASLLAAHGRAGGFIESPALAEGPAGDGPDPELGRTIGPYRIVALLGAGGMGNVYRAERSDAEFEQRVAIKLIRPGIDTEDILARFRQERQVLANLDHPHIARLLDGGSTAGRRPYLVMEHVDGTRIERYCDTHRLAIDARLALFLDVCEAVAYAHRNLVVHRDLKPGNVLVTDRGGVKLLDFGIAKVLEPGGVGAVRDVTATAERRLTPAYASPEQIRGAAVSTATDVYALGVILYELLTGQRPHDLEGATPSEVERIICNDPPTRPSATLDRAAARVSADRSTDPVRLRRAIRGDLERIVLMALRKEPERRYASVEQFADDLRRCLAGRPVIARPDSLTYRTTTFVRRNAVAVAAGLIVLAGLVAATIVSTVMLVRADAAMHESERQRETAERTNRFLQGMLASIDPEYAQGRDVSVLRQVVDEAAARVDEELSDRPQVAASLHLTLGNVYVAIASYDEAETHLRRAVALRSAPGAGAPLDEATSRLALASFLREQSRYDEADPLYREALAMTRRSSPAGLAVADVLVAMGQHLEDTGSYDEAESAYREALDLRTRHLGERDPAVAEALTALGGFLLYQNREPEAETPLRRALVIARATHGEDDLALGAPLVRLASWFRRDRQFEEAERHLRQALEIYRTRLEPDHPRLTRVRGHLAAVYQDMGRFEAAEPLYRETLASQQRVHGAVHKEVGTSTNNLASLLRRIGRHEEAAPLFARATDIYSTVLGPDHYWVTITMANHGRSLAEVGRTEEAEPILREALRLRRQHPAADWQIAEIEMALAPCLTARGEHDAAEAILLRRLPVAEDHFGPDSSAARFALTQLVALYEDWDRPDDAAAWRARLAALD